MSSASSQRIPVAIAVTVTVLGTLTYLSVLPALRKGPGPVGKRLRKTRLEKPLPEGLKRIFIDGPHGGKLELLTNSNEGAQDEGKAPLLLVHGGMGSARCYDRWAAYFASTQRNVYCISLSGHGHSYRPDNFNSITTAELAQDILSAIKHIKAIHPTSPAPVLIGHSAGGGQSQFTVETSPPNTFSGLILLTPFPCTGGLPVYFSWLSFDWLFFPRFFWQGADSMSPLSSPALVKRAFFSDAYKDEDVEEFFKQMNSEESAGWPGSMMGKFADSEAIKANVSGKVHIISASHDRLMAPPIMNKLVELYGCSRDIVQDSGHHIMFDYKWKEAARLAEAKLQAWGL
ncbi:hypothetical protein V5O48_004541 [Marasmius crinis-equi]|uniref:AB hydrolase-1 domain-containing protein n=1 Tax=Marasmius crinis-equi TaxID=585013 RepID=A0ABR3FQT8_9AGAR